MKQKIELSAQGHKAWIKLCHDFSLEPDTSEALMTYMHELHMWNQKTNLTRITDWYEVIEYHIRDALEFANVIDCNHPWLLCDVGTGGGIPGIPLKIVYPQLKVILIEVVERKVAFLQHTIDTLKLKDVEVCTLDWRTFVRTTDAPVHYFIARASLKPDELLRTYKPGSAYQRSQVVYWAAESWQPTVQEEKFLCIQHQYVTGDKKRKLIFFSNAS